MRLLRRVRALGRLSNRLEFAVRYVTRASERYAMRARLYQAAVQLLAVKPAP